MFIKEFIVFIMRSYIDDLTYEISNLEQDIERLEIEINIDRHSTRFLNWRIITCQIILR